MPSTNASNFVILSTESTAREQFQVNDFAPTTRRSLRVNKNVENAVYAHIRAIRALGRTSIVTTDIADALSLSVVQVNRAVSALKKKGVRSLNG